MELLDIVDFDGNPIGATVERKRAHLEGVWHRTSHVWIYRVMNGKPYLLLQKRCMQKDSFPGCYDISSAGHIPAGDSFETSAVRELEEELGIQAREEQLVACGVRRIEWDDEFHGIPYHDRQVTKVFVMEADKEETDFVCQQSEVEHVRWMELAQCVDDIRMNRIKHCISVEELHMLELGAPILHFS